MLDVAVTLVCLVRTGTVTLFLPFQKGNSEHQISLEDYVYLCSCIILLFFFAGIFYEVVRQISMLFIDNKDSVFCIKTTGGYLAGSPDLITNE